MCPTQKKTVLGIRIHECDKPHVYHWDYLTNGWQIELIWLVNWLVSHFPKICHLCQTKSNTWRCYHQKKRKTQLFVLIFFMVSLISRHHTRNSGGWVKVWMYEHHVYHSLQSHQPKIKDLFKIFQIHRSLHWYCMATMTFWGWPPHRVFLFFPVASG